MAALAPSRAAFSLSKKLSQHKQERQVRGSSHGVKLVEDSRLSSSHSQLTSGGHGLRAAIHDRRARRQQHGHVPAGAVESSGPQAVATLAGTPVRDQAEANAATSFAGIGPDMFILELAESLQEQEKPELRFGKDVLERLGEEAASVGLSMRWPTTRDEDFRFTNMKSLRANEIVPAGPLAAAQGADVGEGLGSNLAAFTLKEADGSRLVFVDGVFSAALSSLGEVSEKGVVGSLGTLSEDVVQKYVATNLGAPGGSPTASLDLFSALNAIGALDLGVVVVPQGVKFERPVHIVYLSSGSGKAGQLKVSNPRVLVVVEEEGEVELVEEYAGLGSGYWTNAVTEIVVAARGRVTHGCLQEQGRDAFHIKRTFVSQSEASQYSLVEASLGGRVARHNVRMEQRGADTETALSSFLLAGDRQLQDLHSSVVLDHPRGRTRQLHKCIVTHATGHGVFDGNVKVNRAAQLTDAAQLSRSLLLAPRGTLNVKPNLQIVADDVKCTHGAAISDLEDEQLFYFRARGIDAQAARSALVFSFAAEVIEQLPYPGLRRRIEDSVKRSLLAEGAMDSSVAAGLGGRQL